MVISSAAAPASYDAAARADQQPPGLDPGRHLGQRVLGRLLVDQPAAEQLSLARPGDARVERGLGHADRERADARPEQVEGAHRHREPLVDLAEEVVAADLNAVEDERAEGMRGEHVEPLPGQARAVAGDRERGDARGPGRRAVVRAKTE